MQYVWKTSLDDKVRKHEHEPSGAHPNWNTFPPSVGVKNFRCVATPVAPRIVPNRIISVTATTRVSPWTLSLAARKRVAVWRGFRLVLAFTAALSLMACSAMGPGHGPQAVRIDPSFTSEQAQAITDAVNDWDEFAGLTVAIAAWDDSSAVPIFHDDSIVREFGEVGRTTTTTNHDGDRIRIATSGVFRSCGHDASEYNFYTTAAHELGHLYGLEHSADPTDIMYGHGIAGAPKHEISANDVARVVQVVDKVW